ncbi:MAG: DNA polymerase III subunit chi [Magnetococcales bacterium]|nr:DNA polymerase III subunit chi [Magnetococcales bacterium]
MARSTAAPVIVRFYQLAATPLDAAIARIADKAYRLGLKLCVVAPGPDWARQLDQFLWRFPPEGFLPHALWDDPEAPIHPLIIALEPDDRNGATVAITAGDVLLAAPERFDRVVDFALAGDPQSLADSRNRYRHYRGLGCDMEYWTQNDRGEWAKKS